MMLEFILKLKVIRPFGIGEFVEVDETMRILALSNGTNFKVHIDLQDFDVSSDLYGKTEIERKNLAPFLKPEKVKSYIKKGGPFKSIVVSTDLSGKSDKLVLETIRKCMQAVNKVITAFQIHNLECIKSRKEFDIISRIISPTTYKLSDFGNALIYEIDDNGKTEVKNTLFVRGFVGIGLDSSGVKEVQGILDKGIDAKEFLIKAYSSFTEEEYGFAVVYAALCCENVMKLHIASELSKKGGIPNEKIKDFLRTSNNLLSEVVLRYMTDVPNQLLNDASRLFNDRNNFAHGNGIKIEKKKVLKHILTAESLSKALNWGQ